MLLPLLVVPLVSLVNPEVCEAHLDQSVSEESVLLER